ncbi:MAG: leucyl/phenylalanyl-tRNA--protein transferase [Thiomargarita sp.]|nr:leucyl/phenylalanyl-tRNA--protein transferase [Thiomargarita sp.]
MHRPYWIPDNTAPNDFPPLEKALEHPDGLLAIGGDLNPNRILNAYRLGIFPWYSDDEPILWWSPSKRMILLPEHLKISRSLRKTIRKNKFSITLDQNFPAVIEACANTVRPDQNGTWITDDMKIAYNHLHKEGFAHSVEAWFEGNLVGGLYGIALGKVFFGESMFSIMTDASKVAFVHLVQQLQSWDYRLIDCQVETNHLISLGAVNIPRSQFRELLDNLCQLPEYKRAKWQFEYDEVIKNE